MLNKLKFGISSKVLSGLIFIILIAVISNGMAEFRFESFNTHIQQVTERQLPVFVTVTQLVKGTEKLISNAPDIILAENPMVLEVLTEEVEQSAEEMDQLIDRLKSTNVEPATLSQLSEEFQRLFSNLQTLVDLVNARKRVDTRIHQLSIRIRQVAERFTEFELSVENHQLHPQLHTAFTQVFYALFFVQSVEDEVKYSAFLDRFEAIKNELHQQLETLSAEQAKPFQLYSSTIERYGIGEKGLLALVEQRIQLQQLIQDNLVENKFLSEQVTQHVDQIFATIQKGIQDQTLQIQEETNILGRMLLTIPFILAISALAIFLFIRRSVLGRIFSLEASIHSHVENRPQPLPTQGNDEIAGMAQAVEYFILTRQQAERELTEKKQQLEDLASTLEQKVDEKTKELRLTLERLQQLDRLKDEFLANTSHELRTPLNGIIGLAESLVAGIAGPLPAKANEDLTLLVKSGQRLAALVNDILDFSKIKNDDLQLQCRPVEVKALVDVVMQLSQYLAQQKPLILINDVSDSLPFVEADENRLQQILLNLVGNAIKFTNQGEVRVSAQLVNQRMVIAVKDTGIGIAEDKLDRVFESFEQADGSTAREYGGTGLGLSITKQLVELHGGQIFVESRVDVGSTFSFELPLSHQQPVARETAPLPLLSTIADSVTPIELGESLPTTEEATTESTSTIWVVDDELVNLKVISNFLELKQYRVCTVPNGIVALEQLDEQHPDLMLLDIMMPQMSGYEVARQIRERHGPAQLPIIMLTAKNQTRDLVEGFASGANDYLTKPFQKDELYQRIQNHLNLRTLHQTQAIANQRLAFLFDQTQTLAAAKDKYTAIVEAVQTLLQLVTVEPSGQIHLGFREPCSDNNFTYFQAQVALSEISTESFDIQRLDCISFSQQIPQPIESIWNAHQTHHIFFSENQLNLLFGTPNELLGFIQIEGIHEPQFELHDQPYVAMWTQYLSLAFQEINSTLDLEWTVKDRTQTLTQTLEQLEQVYQHKQEFLQNISHELRTPTDVIQRFTRFLNEGTRCVPPAEEQKRFLEILQQNARRLMNLVNRLLQLSRSQARFEQLRLESIDLHSMLHTVARNLSGIFNEHVVLVQNFSGQPIHVKADAGGLEIVLTNLISNAAKYTKEGSVEIQTELDDRKAKVSVIDTGIGMDESELNFIFERFARSKEVVSTLGTGLGLAITKSFVQEMGGMIGVNSQKDKGSTFWFTLPLSESYDQ